MKKFLFKPKRSDLFLLVLMLVCFIGPVRHTAARLAQGALSQVPGLNVIIHPPPEILTFRSLVPGQSHPEITKEVGPAGGTVELPHVARLEIPPGALEKLTPIKIIQVLQVESTKQFDATGGHDVPDGTMEPGFDFITPVVRLEPFGLKLNIAAKLYLPTNAARVGNNDPKLIAKTGSETAHNESWFFDPYLEPLGTPEAPVQPSIQSPIMVKSLVYISKQFPTDIAPNQGATRTYGIVAATEKGLGATPPVSKK